MPRFLAAIALTLGGLSLLVAAAQAADSGTEASQRFDIHEYRVLGNSVLPPIELERVLYPQLGDGKTLDDVQGARAALEKLYRDRGYGTVYVDIPTQEVNEGIVRLHVTEGRIGRSTIGGARYFPERKVIEHLPGVSPGTVPNFPQLQRQLAAINAETPDRSVVPVLKAGAAPGTVDVDLKVHDRLPLHASVEVNNQQSLDTRPLRAVYSLSYDNMFDELDTLGLQYQMTPQDLSQVKVFGASYAMHPLASGWQPTFFYVKSSSNVPTVGTLGVLGDGEVSSVRLNYPLTADTPATQALTLGVDYKHFRNIIDESANTSLDTPISYTNLSLAYSGSWRSARQVTTLSLAADAGPRGVAADNPGAFANDHYQARSNYFYLRGDLATNLQLPAHFVLRLRAAGQAAQEPLVIFEDFSLSGADGVRGYLESEQLVDAGIKGTVQLQSPILRHGGLQLADSYVFFDAGRGQLIDPLPGDQSHVTLRSFGFGLDVLPGERLTGSLTWARTLTTGPATPAHDNRWLFLIRGAL